MAAIGAHEMAADLAFLDAYMAGEAEDLEEEIHAAEADVAARVAALVAVLERGLEAVAADVEEALVALERAPLTAEEWAVAGAAVGDVMERGVAAVTRTVEASTAALDRLREQYTKESTQKQRLIKELRELQTVLQAKQKKKKGVLRAMADFESCQRKSGGGGKR